MITDKVKKLIATGKISFAIEETIEIAKIVDINLHNEILILSSRHSNYLSADRSGILGRQDQIEKNEIVNSLLGIISEINKGIKISKDKEQDRGELIKENKRLIELVEIYKSQNEKLVSIKENLEKGIEQQKIEINKIDRQKAELADQLILVYEKAGNIKNELNLFNYSKKFIIINH